MSWIENMVDRACAWVSDFLPYRDITGGDGSLYLRRYEVLNFGREKWRLFLHEFHRGDEDRDLHDHPWAWCHSLILVGGYAEERLDWRILRRPLDFGKGNYQSISWGGAPVTRVYRAPAYNRITPDTFHRVELLGEGRTWSLLLTGPFVKSWGFLNVERGMWTHWKDYLAEKFQEPVSDIDSSPFLDPRRPMPPLLALTLDLAEWAFGANPR